MIGVPANKIITVQPKNLRNLSKENPQLRYSAKMCNVQLYRRVGRCRIVILLDCMYTEPVNPLKQGYSYDTKVIKYM